MNNRTLGSMNSTPAKDAGPSVEHQKARLTTVSGASIMKEGNASPSTVQSKPTLKNPPATCPRGNGSQTRSSIKGRNPWTAMEDDILQDVLKKDKSVTGQPVWPQIATKFNERSEGDRRTGKQCRERWTKHLRPNIKKGKWTQDEERTIRALFAAFGPKWSCFAKVMKNRTDLDIKNKWYSMQRTKMREEEKRAYARAFKRASTSPDSALAPEPSVPPAKATHTSPLNTYNIATACNLPPTIGLSFPSSGTISCTPLRVRHCATTRQSPQKHGNIDKQNKALGVRVKGEP